MNPAKQHMGEVAALGCALCVRLGWGKTPAQVHHLELETGAGQRQSDFLTIPLCPEHHTGGTGLHKLGARGFTRRYGVSELDLLAQTLEGLALERMGRVGWRLKL